MYKSVQLLLPECCMYKFRQLEGCKWYIQPSASHNFTLSFCHNRLPNGCMCHLQPFVENGRCHYLTTWSIKGCIWTLSVYFILNVLQLLPVIDTLWLGGISKPSKEQYWRVEEINLWVNHCWWGEGWHFTRCYHVVPSKDWCNFAFRPFFYYVSL